MSTAVEEQTLVDKFLKIRRRINQRKMTLEKIKEKFEACVLIRSEFVETTCQEHNAKQLQNLATRCGSYQAKTSSKAENAERIYEALMQHCFYLGGGMFSYTLEYGLGKDGRDTAWEDALRKSVDKATQDDLDRIADAHDKEAAEDKARVEMLAKSMKDPETAEEFRQYLDFDGCSYMKLSAEKRALCDAVLAIESQAARRKKLRERDVVEAINLDGLEFALSKNYHSKRECEIWTATPNMRMGSDFFDKAKITAGKLGGWYYKAYKGTPGGFHFLSVEDRDKFLVFAAEGGDTEGSKRRREIRQMNAQNRLRAMAEDHEEKWNSVLNADRKTNTEKRAREAGYQIASATAGINQCRVMRQIADAIEAGNARSLVDITEATQLSELRNALRAAKYKKHRHFREIGEPMGYRAEEEDLQGPATPEDVDYVDYPYPWFRIELWDQIAAALKGKRNIKHERNFLDRLRKWSVDRGSSIVEIRSDYQQQCFAAVVRKLQEKKRQNQSILDQLKTNERQNRLRRANIYNSHELRAALRDYIAIRDGVKLASVDPIRELELALVGRKIDGFWPTPPSLIDRMLDELDLRDGHRFLEPEAGKGDIVDRAIERCESLDIVTCEVNHSLREILTAKGYSPEWDFFGLDAEPFDRIAMNPPFEKGQDMEHVKEAFGHLKCGGRLVAIMSAGSFSRTDRKSTAFREWLDEVNGYDEQLPEGSFSGSESFRSTGVNVRLVVIDK